MWGRRFGYLAALFGCWMLYIAYGEWFSWLALLAVAGLPWLSLLLSLPAMLRFRLEPGGAGAVTLGTEAEAWLVGSCGLPMPPFKGRLYLRSRITGQTRRYRSGEGLPTRHCGGYAVTIQGARVCDYLGLFALPVRHPGRATVLVRPKPLPVREVPDLDRFLAKSWKPKFGGGFSENHELRLYRPGDSLNQVHWKLSAKTGKLMLRQPMEPQRGLVLVTMTLRGDPSELDRKFGRLLWLGRYLAERNVSFELRVLTGQGVQSFPVDGERALNKAIDSLLCTEAAEKGSIRDHPFAASWHCHIGGEPDES